MSILIIGGGICGLGTALLLARDRDTLRQESADPYVFAEAFHARTEAEISPWYGAQIAVDRARFAEMEALQDANHRNRATRRRATSERFSHQ